MPTVGEMAYQTNRNDEYLIELAVIIFINPKTWRTEIITILNLNTEMFKRRHYHGCLIRSKNQIGLFFIVSPNQEEYRTEFKH